MWRNDRSKFSAAFVKPTSSAGGGNLASVPPPASLTLGSGQEAAADQRQREEEYAQLLELGASRAKRPPQAVGRPSSSAYYGKATQNELNPSGSGRKRRGYDDDDDEDYLEGDDDPADGQLEYIPAPDSPSAVANKPADDEEAEDDPLDAFMADIEKQAEADKAESEQKDKNRDKELDLAEQDKKKQQLGRADIDEEDMQESYFRFLEERKTAQDSDEEILEYDEEGNVLWSWKKTIDPLPPVDHASIEYPNFQRNFYHEHADIAALDKRKVEDLRRTLNVHVSGLEPPKPVASFAHFHFDEQMMGSIRKSEYSQPTPIQAQGIPAVLTGRDVIGIAKTGSGKTAAYLWPALVHLMHQPDLKEGDGPIVLIVVPTRELAIQVYHEAKKFGKVYNVNVVCAYGGGSKWEQQNALLEGAEIVVGTPGRIIDMVKIQATNLERVTYLVFDEADRMFDMGFEAQVRSIADHVRPDRQCLMFSATFKKKVERLARDALIDPIRIVQGEVGEANADIDQTVEVLADEPAKWTWLTERLVKFSSGGKVLIFVTKKQNSDELAKNLRKRDFPICLLHGDMMQSERNETLTAFRREIPILVATDVAARGLDIPEIRIVINYDVARDIDTHVHRIGRTGRAGEKGAAFTLVTVKDKEFAGHLVRNLESVNQKVPKALMNLALQSAWFRSSRGAAAAHNPHGAQQLAIAGGPPTRLGLGFKPRVRAGLGAPKSSRTLEPEASTSAAHSNSAAAPSVSTAATSKTAGARALEQALNKTAPSGPASNRLWAMKSAYGNSFKSSFHCATDDDGGVSKIIPTDPTPEWRKQAQQIAAAIGYQAEKGGEQADDAQKKKRSRWGD